MYEDPVHEHLVYEIKPQAKLSLVGEPDHIFADGLYPKRFAFTKEVAQVFDDMVSRSVPLYHDVTTAAADWAEQYYQEGSYIYDIGCSTGTTIATVAERLHQLGRAGRFVGIDPSKPMLTQAEEKLHGWLRHHEIVLRANDALDASYDEASVVIMNYTLQFIPVSKRLLLLSRIYQNLRPGGILFLSDKVRSVCPELQESVTTFYERFKESRGYSRTEIERKKEALDHVLVPLSYHEQMQLIGAAGFEFYEPVFKWNNFMSILALKR